MKWAAGGLSIPLTAPAGRGRGSAVAANTIQRPNARSVSRRLNEWDRGGTGMPTTPATAARHPTAQPTRFN